MSTKGSPSVFTMHNNEWAWSGLHYNHDRNEILPALGMQTTANLPTLQKAEEFNKPLKILWFGLWSLAWYISTMLRLTAKRVTAAKQQLYG